MTDTGARTERVVRQILGSLLDTIEEQEGFLHSEQSVEGVHQFRVAIRRTRSVAGQMSGAFKDEDLDYFLTEFKWIAVITGPIRDIDVFLERIEQYRDERDSNASGPVDTLVELLRRERRAGMLQLNEAIAGERYRSLKRRWRKVLEGEPVEASDEAAEAVPVGQAAADAIGRAHRALLRRSIALLASDKFEVTVVHRLRISCKKLRYLLEAFADVLGHERVAGLIDMQKRVQDGAGEFHDLGLQRMRLSALAPELKPTPDSQSNPATARSLADFDGWLVAELERTETELRAALTEFTGTESTRRFEQLLVLSDDAPDSGA